MLWTRFACFARNFNLLPDRLQRKYPQISHRIQWSNDAGLSKQCMNVKTVVGLKCQNGAGMSKLCRYILSKWCRFRQSFGTRSNHKSSSIHTSNVIATEQMNVVGEASKASSQGIFIGIMSYFDINHSLRSIFGEEFSMNLSRLLGSERINVYSGQSKQSEFTRLMPSLWYTSRVDVVMSQSSLCLITRLLRSTIREAFVVCNRWWLCTAV